MWNQTIFSNLISVISKDDLNVSQRLFKSLTPEEHLAAIGFVNRDGWNRTQDLKEDSLINDTPSTWSRVFVMKHSWQTQPSEWTKHTAENRLGNERCVFNLDHQYDHWSRVSYFFKRPQWLFSVHLQLDRLAVDDLHPSDHVLENESHLFIQKISSILFKEKQGENVRNRTNIEYYQTSSKQT